ncbi:FapA family protein [Shewanella electrodiphila]|uniref:FapA family protein n=1 Tax=Shewanella electrodiphila TaxID=934143 RepID=A0ABT0KSV9_9GAMM|nr:FapA family protein [Shewanella electrodiphila]MCL1046631.1 FapA family protein [Shewanella electrodiphila]
MLDWSLAVFNENQTQVEFRVIPNTHGPVSEDDVSKLLTQPEFAMLRPMQHNIHNAVAEINALCGQDNGQHELFFVIAERADGKVIIDINEDKMSASMTLEAAWGGKDPSLPIILNGLKSYKVKMGLSKPKILSLIKQLAILPPGESCDSVIAVGKLPANGINANLSRKVPLARERLLQPQEREDGSVDMRNLGAMIMVKPGDVLMVKTPATSGTAGYNIHGEAILQVEGKDLSMQPGSGTEIDPEDPYKLIATVAGQPVENKKGMQVDDMLQIKDVDVKYGHVDFEGSILITGDVHEGMKVKSSGDITVMGFVESATLEANGDVIVSKGIIGRQIKEHELSNNITAQGQICAQFVQYSNLTAHSDILVTKQLLHSHSQSDSFITVSDPSAKRGDLVGGRATAKNGIKAVAFGATAGTKTELYCAMHQTELRAEVKECDAKAKKLVVMGLEIEARLRKLPPKSEWQTDAGMIEQVKMMLDEKKEVANNRAKAESECKQLQQEVGGYYSKHFIQAEQHIFSNVEIHIGPAQNRTQREHGPCQIKNLHNEISFDYGSH